jgi:hypothetical protein
MKSSKPGFATTTIRVPDHRRDAGSERRRPSRAERCDHVAASEEDPSEAKNTTYAASTRMGGSSEEPVSSAGPGTGNNATAVSNAQRECPHGLRRAHVRHGALAHGARHA